MHVKEFLKSGADGHMFRVTGDDCYWSHLLERRFIEMIDETAREFDVLKIEKYTGIESLKFAIAKPPVFGDKTLVLVTDADTSQKAADEGLFKLLQSVPEDCILVFFGAMFLPKKAEALFTEISADKLTKNDLFPEVRALFPSGIEEKAVEKLIEYSNREMQKILLESLKLTAYTQNKFVRREDVEELVSSDAEVQAFEFTNLLNRRDKQGAFRVMNKLLKKGEQPQYLLSTLTGQYRRMLFAAISPLSDLELSKKLNIKEYAITKTREVAMRTKPVVLKKTFDRLTSLEYRARCGELSGITALNLAVEYLLEG